MSTQTYVDGVTLTSAAEFNNFDTVAYSVFSGVAGTNTLTATGPANYTYSATRPPVYFTPVATNTVSTTLNVTPSGGVALGSKNIFYKGAACRGGELVAGVPVAVIYDGTQFNLIGGAGMPRVTASLGADVALSTTAAYFDGPSVAQGTSGAWYASGTISVYDPSGSARFLVKLWDGTSVIASAEMQSPAGNQAIAIAMSGYISSPAGNIRISVRDVTTTNGLMVFNNSGNSKDSTVSAVRIG